MMSGYVVCYLSFPLTETIEWGICDNKGNMVEEPRITPLSELKPHLVNRPLLALAPASTYVIHHTTLPAKQIKRLQLAIPYALEDQLSNDIEQLHFAIFSEKTQDSQMVVVIAQSILQSWLSAFSQHQLKLAAIIPDLLCLPSAQENCTLVITEKDVLITVKEDLEIHYFYTDKDNLSPYLKLLFKKYPALTSSLRVYHPYTLTRQELIPFISAETWENQIISEPLIWFTQHYLSSHTLNDFSLLQGKYRQKTSTKNLYPWYATAALTCLFLISLWTTKIIEWQVYRHHAQQLQQAIRQAYFEIFPKASEMVSPKLRIEQLLKNIQQQNQQQAFFSILSQMAKTWDHNNPDPIFIKNILYQPPALSLQLEAANLSTLDEFVNKLKAQKLSLKQIHAGLQNDKASMELQILEGGGKSS